MKTTWNNQRLERLFANYNRRFWAARLKAIPVKLGACPGKTMGYWQSGKGITVDVMRHPSDREIRSTLLHEMCHHASGDTSGLGGHGPKFFSQLERLLRQGAPVSIGSPETGGVVILSGVVPKRFPLCCALMEKAERQREKEVYAVAAKEHASFSGETIGLETIAGQVERLVSENGVMPNMAIKCVSAEYGLTNIEGKPTSRWAGKVLKAARKAAKRARHEYLAERRREEQFNRRFGTVTAS
jgi:hypothetical protein